MPVSKYLNPLTDVFFEQATDFMGLYDLEKGWFVRVNPAAWRQLGYASAQALYDDPARTLRPAKFGEPEWQQLLSRVAREGRVNFESGLRRQTGEVFWATVELTHLPLPERTYLLVRIANTDRLHTAERDLAQSRERFEAVFTHSTIGIIVCNRRGDTVLANAKAREQLGFSAEAMLAQRLEKLVPDAVDSLHEPPTNVFDPDAPAQSLGPERHLVAWRRDGSVFPVEVSLSYFHQDEELYIVVHLIDITAKKEAERELRAQHEQVARLNAELEQKVAERTQALQATLAQLEQALQAEKELSELKSRFVAMASHEFRTPLTAVLTSTTLIEKYPAVEHQAKRLHHLERIRELVKHLTDILEEFLAVGQLEEGALTPRPGPIDLAALVPEAVAEVQAHAKEGQRIDVTLPTDTRMHLDGSLLRKILVNLLSNALKYSDAHTVTTLRARVADHRLTIAVQDHGVGIAEEDQPHLFERFFRARNVTNLPGTGLGLHIIARYLDLMGGTIHLQSALHQGTTVTITLPYENHPAD